MCNHAQVLENIERAYVQGEAALPYHQQVCLMESMHASYVWMQFMFYIKIAILA
jgi:hypothetical protein